MFYLLLTFLTVNSYGNHHYDQDKVRTCLGKEELKFHKENKRGALYEFNNNIIALMAANPVKVNPRDAQKICAFKSPAVGLLTLTIEKGERLFTNTKKGLGPTSKFLENLPKLFFSYISSVQQTMPTANCLTKHIPHLKELQENFLYLEDVVGTKRLFSEKRKLLSIVNNLSDAPRFRKLCLQEKKASEKKN